MLEITRKYAIHKNDFPLDGIYEYNAQVWLSVDGGKNFWYCGIGKYFKTGEEARTYIEAYERDNGGIFDESKLLFAN